MPSPYGKTVGGLLSDYAGGIFEENPNAMTLLPVEFSDRDGFGVALPRIIPAIANEVYDALTLPGDVYSGKREANAEEALRFTGALAGGSLLAPVPKNALRMFGGPAAKTANKTALRKAQEMELDGLPGNQIRQETGWFKGADDKWRFEIDDSPASLSGTLTDKGLARKSSIRQVIDHDELFKAYPQLADIRPAVAGNMNGFFAPPSSVIDYPRIGLNPNRPSGDVKGTTLHELQHAVQDIEGFARGGTPAEFAAEGAEAMQKIPLLNKTLSEISQKIDTAKQMELDAVGESATRVARERTARLRSEYEEVMSEKLGLTEALDPIGRYQRLAGEVEARNTQRRMDMTPEERFDKAPESTEDIGRERQSVKFRVDDVMSEYDKIVRGEID
jgi:hypothetical protein